MSDQETGTPREPLDVSTVLAVMVDQLASIAWQKLGLQPDVMTGRVEPDLVQAKLAIDAASGMAALFEAQLDESDRRSLQNLMRDLRINYVERAKEA